MMKKVQWYLRVLGLVALMAGLSGLVQAQGKSFDHSATGFDLTGGHNFVPCESCHVGGQFAGTPRECVACHSINGLINATPKPVEHIFTSERCDACHSTVAWQAVPMVDHHEVFGRCENCHNNVVVPGKPAHHIPTHSECIDCHSTLSWQPAHFSHSNVGENCVSCHNGINAVGQHVDHIRTTMECGSCHSTVAFQPVIVNHDFVQGTCFSCHNNNIARGWPQDHIAVQPECDACHRNTVAFAPVPAENVDHGYVIGACFDCHNNQVAPGQPMNHIPVREPLCGNCHSTEVWSPPVRIDLDLLAF